MPRSTEHRRRQQPTGMKLSVTLTLCHLMSLCVKKTSDKGEWYHCQCEWYHCQHARHDVAEPERSPSSMHPASPLLTGTAGLTHAAPPQGTPEIKKMETSCVCTLPLETMLSSMASTSSRSKNICSVLRAVREHTVFLESSSLSFKQRFRA